MGTNRIPVGYHGKKKFKTTWGILEERKEKKTSISFLAKRKHFVFQFASQDLHVVSILLTTL
jgi:hypothetical protein